VGTSFIAEGKAGHGEAAPGDHLQTGYQLWLVGHQLEHGRAPWRDPYSFRPEVAPRWNLAGWPFGYVYWPLQRVFGTVAGWNVFVLLGFVGAGWLAATWLRQLGLRRPGAITGGLAFALAPYLQAQWSAGHLLAWIAMLLPLSLYGLERARRGSDWWLVLAAAALATIPFSGQLHFALGAILFFALYALVRHRIGVALTIPAAAAGLLAYALAIRGTTGVEGRSFAQVERYSASGGDFVSRSSDPLESMVYLGWSVLVIASAGLAILIVRRRFGLATVLAAGAVVPMLLALGSNLPGYETLWRHAPGLRHTRVPERLMPVACLALAALVAVAVSRLRWPGTAVRADEGNRAYSALRAEPPGRILELPVYLPDRQEASAYLYYLGQTPREHPSGYSTTAPRAADSELRALRRSPCRDLDALDVRYVVTHFGRPNPCGGILLARDGPVASYRLP
jgi:hypothetical protein